MPRDILFYGANGYTAELITELAVKQGARPILAGRSRDKVDARARRHGLPSRVFALDTPATASRAWAWCSTAPAPSPAPRTPWPRPARRRARTTSTSPDALARVRPDYILGIEGSRREDL